jgi:hypothetical protein
MVGIALVFHRVSGGNGWLYVVEGATAILVLVLVLDVLPRALVPSSKGLSEVEHLREINNVRSTLVQAVAGAALIGGLYFTAQTLRTTNDTLELNRVGQVTERFTRAITELGDDKIDVRLGAIYALERIAKESREDRGPITDILTAYLHEHDPWTGGGPCTEVSFSTLPAGVRPRGCQLRSDLQAILTVLGRRVSDRSDGVVPPLDLTDLDLRGAELVGAHLEHSNLHDSHLERADLRDAHLEGANLAGAHLEVAVLQGTHLEGATLDDSDLDGADIGGAHLPPR